MNAFTSSDHTTYPFATTNKQDFQNLLSVYLDATFHPLLKEEDFRQEGWRLGPENPRALEVKKRDPSEPPKVDDILFKGVVYNEMKGQMSDGSYLYHIRFQEHIFPSIKNSGGDPQFITNLTHEQLVGFSKRNYHPSNSKIFTYGDMSLSDHLKQIGEVLDGFEIRPADKEVKLPIDLSQGPINVKVEGPIDSLTTEDRQFKTSMSWYMGDTRDIVETFSVGILSSLFLEGYGSPMHRAIIESGFGSSFTPNTGLDTSVRTPIFSIGACGVKEDDVSKFRDLIQGVFKDAIQNGLSEEKIQGALHQLELALRHKTPNFGISVMEKTISAWFNGCDPMKGLAWNEIINEFKRRHAQPGYFESLVQKYLLTDKHFTFTMVGSPNYSEQLDENEAIRLKEKLDELSNEYNSLEKAVSELEKSELELLKIQEDARHSDLSCLPALHIDNISRQKERKETRESIVDDVNVVWREAPTNGLSYFQALNVFEGLPDDLRCLLPLFNDCIMRLGTPERSMEDWEDLIKLNTGGISVSQLLVSSPVDLNVFSEGLQFSGYALDKNIPTMLDILQSLVTRTHFRGPEAPALIIELLRSGTIGSLDNVAASGHRYALTAAASCLSQKAWIQEQQSGLTQLQSMANLLQDVQTSPDRLAELIEKLHQIQSFAISRSQKLRIRIVCERESARENEATLQKWLAGLPQGVMASKGTADNSYTAPRKLLYELPYKVYYTGLALQTVPFIDQSSAPLSVLSQLLTHKYLHPEIREKGGAYGASASSSALAGTFALTSYRDPNPNQTLDVFKTTGMFARDRSWTAQELEEAKLSIFQGLDAPTSVDEEGMLGFMSGITHEMDQRWREQVLDVTPRDINEVAQNYLVDNPRQAVCVLGEKKAFTDQNDWIRKELSLDHPEVAPSNFREDQQAIAAA